jgi:hypothetical protein
MKTMTSAHDIGIDASPRASVMTVRANAGTRQPALVVGQPRKRCAIRDRIAVEQPTKDTLDGWQSDQQPTRDFRVGRARGDERHDLELSRSRLTTPMRAPLSAAAEMALPPSATVRIDRTILSGEAVFDKKPAAPSSTASA